MDAAVAAAVAEERKRSEEACHEAVEAARAAWAAEEGARLAALVDERVEEMARRLRQLIGNVLKPVVFDARRRQSVLELADTAKLLLSDGKSVALHASGPADLIEAFAAALGPRRDLVVAEPDGEAVDLRVECNQTVIETRLKKWRKSLGEALA